jgi:hypothetical protein
VDRHNGVKVDRRSSMHGIRPSSHLRNQQANALGYAMAQFVAFPARFLRENTVSRKAGPCDGVYSISISF